jgi:cytochrome c oxidase subunit 2
MWQNLPLFPESASTVSDRVDLLYAFLIAVALFFSLLISALIAFFAVRYRKGRVGATATQIEGSLVLELGWTIIPLLLTLVMFGWGAWLFFETAAPPPDALQFWVTGKQWMWKAQHPSGQREINDLHVPVDTPIRITMTSEDVIHSYFIPAFRVKQDVLPGRYSSLWFEATQVGTYDLFCAEYCGTKHSQMIGKVHVMRAEDYEAWLAGAAPAEPPAEAGAKLFSALRCDTCHNTQSGARGPDLAGRFGGEVRLQGGGRALFDPTYVRESILRPNARLVEGFGPLMPTYQGQVSEDQILQITAYLESLASGEQERP